MELDARFGVLLHERTDATCLRAGQKLTDYAACCQIDRIFLARIVDWRPVVGNVEASTSIRKIEGPGTTRNGVVTAWFEQPWRARVVRERLAGLRVLAVARPEDAHLAFDFFVG